VKSFVKFRRYYIFILIPILIFSYGCTIKLKEYTLLSTVYFKSSDQEMGPKVSGSDCTYYFFFPLDDYYDDEANAINSAIESAGPDYNALINPKITYHNQVFMIGRTCVEVEGVAVRIEDLNITQESENQYIFHSSMHK
jgi:hypothetical protein